MREEIVADRTVEESGGQPAPREDVLERGATAPPERTEDLLDRYLMVRRFSETLCEPLANEDMVIQSMSDASPLKWHLAHTSWFFETFVLAGFSAGNHRALHPQYAALFNSYYHSLGARHPRPQRGLLSRPTVDETYFYRRHVDESMAALIGTAEDEGDEQALERMRPIVELGIQHEQQHQELMLTDVKHAFSVNPLLPSYRSRRLARTPPAPPLHWVTFAGGLFEIGHNGKGFCFDNETPRHRVFLEPFALASRPVTCGEYLSFMGDDGYKRPELWLAEGWDWVQRDGIRAPQYWSKVSGLWHEFTLSGLVPVDEHRPVSHVSYFEADAYARWAGARLPTEECWERAAAGHPAEGHFADSGIYHPTGVALGENSGELHQLFGDVWEWTRSSYAPYPGFRTAEGAAGEYNGKFMCNQYVLRGGSCATPHGHIRATYRNFFPAAARWQFSGIRLAREPER